jgi:RNase adaptor protein for sRNA GlmZ degradation
MLSTFSRLLLPNSEDMIAIEKAALVINIRERHFLSEFQGELNKLKRKKLKPFVIFFEASDHVLQRRFSETRRPHPAENGKGLLASIRAEKKGAQRCNDDRRPHNRHIRAHGAHVAEAYCREVWRIAGRKSVEGPDRKLRP